MGTSSFPPTSITVNNNTTYSGVVFNTAGLTVDEASTGILTLSGSSANTYGNTVVNGYTAVNGGTLKLNKTAGVNAIAKGAVVINVGGTLLLAAANQIADTVTMTLAGGTFTSGGFSETLGALTLPGNSIINLGANGTVAFADSSAVSWPAGATITINGWSGSFAGGGTNQIKFGTTSAGLTADQLAQVQFLDPANTVAGTYAAQILSTGEVVPAVNVEAPCSQTNVLSSISANPRWNLPVGIYWHSTGCILRDIGH